MDLFLQEVISLRSVDGFALSLAFIPKIKAGHAKIVDNLWILTGSDHRMVYLDLIDSAAVQGEK